jgi:hypothetical protein
VRTSSSPRTVATAAKASTGGVDRSQAGRVRRQVDELMEGIRPLLLDWVRGAV